MGSERESQWLKDFPGKFCENQLPENGEIWCGHNAIEGYNCRCPYGEDDLRIIDGKLMVQRDPQPNADGVCRDFEPLPGIPNVPMLVIEADAARTVQTKVLDGE